MNQQQIFWIRRSDMMKKFHAFPLDSGRSLCGKWFVGGAADALEESEENDSRYDKCKKCQLEFKSKRHNPTGVKHE